MQAFFLIFKGFLIGLSNLIPGLSGSTMALILGIYERFLLSLGELFRFHWSLRLWFFFLMLGSGIFLGFSVGALFFSGWLNGEYRLFVMTFFLGLLIVSLIEVAPRLGPISLSYSWFFIGIFALVFLRFLPELSQYFIVITKIPSLEQGIILLLSGALVTAAMLIPGLSGAFILLILGLYDIILLLFKQGQFVFLFPFFLGVLAGFFLAQQGLEYLLRHHKKSLYAGIFGLLAGSLVSFAGDLSQEIYQRINASPISGVGLFLSLVSGPVLLGLMTFVLKRQYSQSP